MLEEEEEDEKEEEEEEEGSGRLRLHLLIDAVATRGQRGVAILFYLGIMVVFIYTFFGL